MTDLSKLLLTGLLTALLTGAASAATTTLAADKLEVLTGRVAEILPQQMLMLQAGDRRVLVYADSRSMATLQVGANVRIEGEVPRDWLRLSRDEFKARQITVLRSGA